MGKLTIAIIIVLILGVGIFFIYQVATPKVSAGNSIETEKEQKCHSDYVLKISDTQYLGNDINHNCPSITGGVRQGEFEVTLEITNPNDIDLSIPCSLVISKTNFDVDPPVQYDKKILTEWTLEVKRNSKEFITKNFEIPECYGNWNVECKNISELPECN